MIVSLGNASIAEKIGFLVNEIEEDLKAAKKEEAKTISKRVESLLIQYILAQMAGDTKAAEAAGSEIGSLIQTYGHDMQKADHLNAQLQSIAKDPADQTAQELASLEALLALVQGDVKSGNLSNLPGTG